MSENPVVMGALAATWLVCGAVLLVSGALAARSRRWRLVGRGTTAVLFVGADAAVNAAFLLTGTDYGGFADSSYSAFVRDAWAAVVAPRQGVWIGLLVVFELAVGTAALLGGRATRYAYVAAVAFHVCLLAFGFGFWLWALPVALAFGLLLRAELRRPGGVLGTRSPSRGTTAGHAV